MRVPSREPRGPRKAKASRRRVVFPIGLGPRNWLGRRSSEALKRVLSLRGKDHRRLEETWAAFGAALSCVLPGCVKGLPLSTPGVYKTMCGIRRLYLWIIKSWVFQGEDWTLTRIKSICDWSQYYATLSDYDHPELPTGTLGGGRDGWLDFPWAQGLLAEKIFPTRGPRARIPPGMEEVVPGAHSGDHFSFCLYEIYSVKGALPGPPKEVIQRSLLKHHQVLSSRVTPPRGILEACENFGRAYREAHPPNPKSIHWTISGSAILESPRSKGGRASWIQDLSLGLPDLLRSLVYDVRRIYGEDGPPPMELYDALGEVVLEFPGGAEEPRVLGAGVYTFVFGYSYQPRDLHFFSQEDPLKGEDPWSDRLRDWILKMVLFSKALDEGWVPTVVGEPVVKMGKSDYIVYNNINPYLCLYGSPPQIDLYGFTPKGYTVRPSVVEEQGAKARVITISPGVLSTLLHLLRTYCFSSLRKDAEVGTLAGEGTLVDFLRRVNQYLKDHPDYPIEKKVILSLDLTSATDTFSQEVCQRILRGFLSEEKISEILLLEPLATLGVHVDYSGFQGLGLQDIEVTTRGILMGNPSSWFLLNLFTRFFWELSGFIFRRTHRRPLEEVLNEVSTGNFDFSQFPDRALTADPLTNRCGDDQISLCSPRRALIFERILPLGGGIISPGVHLRSRTYGIFTKQLCSFDRVNRKFDFVDILRARQLSTPDSRLPRSKEVPPSWSRGLVAEKETSWWDGEVRASAITFLHWRYHEFISWAISCSIEVYLPRVFGGAEYPHHTRKVKFLSGKTKRMMSILLKNDLSVEHLKGMVKLGGLWNPLTSSPMGEGISESLDLYLEMVDTKSLDGICKDSGIPPPIYPDLKGLWKAVTLVKALPEYEDEGILTWEEFSKEAAGKLYESFSWRFPAPTIEGTPSLRGIGKRFQRIRQDLLLSDPYNYAPLKVSDMSDLVKRWKFKLNSLMVLNTKESLQQLTSL